MPYKLSTKRGYTLLELLVVLAMVGILAAIAVPSFATQIKQGRVTSNANQLHSVFKFARSEAAKRGEQVNLSVSGDTWTVKVGTEKLSVFEPSHSSIAISTLDAGAYVNGLKAVAISDTGSTTTEKFLIGDSDAETSDYYLCIYVSGQSKLSKGTECA